MLGALCLFLTLSARPDLPIGNIKPGSYGDWEVRGDAFRLGPASGKVIRDLEITRNLTDAVISSEREGDKPTGALVSPEFTIERSHISFRIGGGDYKGSTCMQLMYGDEILRSATGHRSDRLASENWDVSQFRGKDVRIIILDDSRGDWGHINVDRIVQTDSPEPTKPMQPLYHEPLRPLFHVTARYWKEGRLEPVEHQEGWINDLNGLIYYEGEYHMFAQRWATCWLHFVSKDLVHWTELEPAFWEESLGVGTQSGTCVIDYKNTSGLGKDPAHPPMVAFWSRFDNRSQCLCYSLDKGRTWQRYAKNPFMLKPERDPKVFWYEPGQHWVMVMYGDGAYHILNSPNLLDWTDTGNPVPDSFECPDMFELPVVGGTGKKWVLVQGSGQVSIGTFDGKRFVAEGERQPCDIGPNFYATQSWHNTETGDGRRVQAAWMRGSVFPDMPFSQQVSFPCQLTLHQTPAGLRVFREPIQELESLHAGSSKFALLALDDGESHVLASSGDALRIRCDVELSAGARLEFGVREASVVVEGRELTSGEAKGSTQGPVKHIELLVDRGSIETFLNHGEVSSTRYALLKGQGVTVKVTGGTAKLTAVEVNPLKGIWPASVKL